MEFRHIPVMPEECMQALAIKNDGIYFDGTLGGAGHSRMILERCEKGFLFATDLDEQAIEAARKKLSDMEGRFALVHDNFKNFAAVADGLGISEIDGALLDLGVSSYQLDERERGFSYMAENTKLDMRMDRTQSFSAYELVNEYDEKQLTEVLETFGEERFSRQIARNIVQKRREKAIETTGELVEIIERSIPAKFKREGGHPAKRTFQAIRIEVNGELGGLDKALRDVVARLKRGGRFAVITFHSLEDRIVKRTFADLATGCTCDKSFPICVCGRKSVVKQITKKPITAGEAELSNNKRSQSAKLRVIEKL